MTLPFGSYRIGLVRRVSPKRNKGFSLNLAPIMANIHWSVYVLFIVCCAILLAVRWSAAAFVQQEERYRGVADCIDILSHFYNCTNRH